MKIIIVAILSLIWSFSSGQSFVSKDTILDNKIFIPKDIGKKLKSSKSFRLASVYDFRNGDYAEHNKNPFSFLIFNGITTTFMTERDNILNLEKFEYPVKYKIENNFIIFTEPCEVEKFKIIKLTDSYMVLESLFNGKPSLRQLYINNQ